MPRMANIWVHIIERNYVCRRSVVPGSNISSSKPIGCNVCPSWAHTHSCRLSACLVSQKISMCPFPTCTLKVDALSQLCKCPRVCHKKCLARWQVSWTRNLMLARFVLLPTACAQWYIAHWAVMYLCSSALCLTKHFCQVVKLQACRCLVAAPKCGKAWGVDMPILLQHSPGLAEWRHPERTPAPATHHVHSLWRRNLLGGLRLLLGRAVAWLEAHLKLFLNAKIGGTTNFNSLHLPLS
jgi:hypothetical protein